MILIRHQAHFVISEGHVLQRRRGSSIAKSDLIDHDHEEGTHKGSSKVKQPICDITERTMGLCSSNWKYHVHDMCGNILTANLTFASLPTRTLFSSSICHAVL